MIETIESMKADKESLYYCTNKMECSKVGVFTHFVVKRYETGDLKLYCPYCAHGWWTVRKVGEPCAVIFNDRKELI